MKKKIKFSVEITVDTKEKKWNIQEEIIEGLDMGFLNKAFQHKTIEEITVLRAV
jgi:hypothetical protein